MMTNYNNLMLKNDNKLSLTFCVPDLSYKKYICFSGNFSYVTICIIH